MGGNGHGKRPKSGKELAMMNRRMRKGEVVMCSYPRCHEVNWESSTVVVTPRRSNSTTEKTHDGERGLLFHVAFSADSTLLAAI